MTCHTFSRRIPGPNAFMLLERAFAAAHDAESWASPSLSPVRRGDAGTLVAWAKESEAHNAAERARRAA